MPIRSSRQRYRNYREKIKQRNKEDHSAHTAVHDHDPDKKNKKPRSRPFLVLLSQFWSLLRGFRPTMVQALIALTISTGLGLLPLYGTKIVFDSVLREHPLPARLPHWLPIPTTPRHLLTFVAAAMVLIAAVSEAFGLWSRWQTTRSPSDCRFQFAKKFSIMRFAFRCIACTN